MCIYIYIFFYVLSTCKLFSTNLKSCWSLTLINNSHDYSPIKLEKQGKAYHSLTVKKFNITDTVNDSMGNILKIQ